LVTTFVFRVRNLRALYKALGGFATNVVNMTSSKATWSSGNLLSPPNSMADFDGHPTTVTLAVCAGRASILLARISHRRRLSRPSVPRDVSEKASEVSFRAPQG